MVYFILFFMSYIDADIYIPIYRVSADIIHINLADQEGIQEIIREIQEKVTSAKCADYIHVVERNISQHS